MDKISNLMDGELDARQRDLQLARLKEDPEARESWDMFHLIGDAMRGGHVVNAYLPRRLSERLAQEPTVLAPRPMSARRVSTYAFSIAAALSAVSVVGWMVFHDSQPPQVEARIPAQLVSVPSNGKMNEYLIAHQEFSPSTAFQGLAAYIRTVSGARPAKD